MSTASNSARQCTLLPSFSHIYTFNLFDLRNMSHQFGKLNNQLEQRPQQSLREDFLRPLVIDPTTPHVSLCALPIELIEQIASGSESVDVCSLRLVCRTLFRNTLSSFGLVCLATVRTNLSPTSLQKLEELSQNEQLRRCVQNLDIQSSHHSSLEFNGVGQGFPWTRSPLGTIELPHQAVQTLQDVLLKLENCRSFYINVPHFKEEMPDCLSASAVLAIVLHIIAEASLPVKSIWIEPTYAWDVTQLHLQTYQTPKFKSAWARLQQVSIHHPQEEDFDLTVNLISSATGLRRLSLHIGNDDELLDNLSSCDKLPMLQELHLEQVRWASPETLSRFLLRFGQTLRSLSVHNSWVEGNTWEPIFSLLRSDFPLLRTITLQKIKIHGYLGWRWVVFPKLYENPSPPDLNGGSFVITEKITPGRKPSTQISYSGQEMDMALDILTKSMEYRFL